MCLDDVYQKDTGLLLNFSLNETAMSCLLREIESGKPCGEIRPGKTFLVHSIHNKVNLDADVPSYSSQIVHRAQDCLVLLSAVQ